MYVHMSDDIDIENVSKLARIEVSKAQARELKASISDILEYVESVEEVAEAADDSQSVGSVHNVLREDKDPHDSGAYREEILAEVPQTENGFIVVPPIL